MKTLLFLFLNLVMVFSSHLLAFRYFRESRLSAQLITTFLIYVTQINITVIFLGVVVKNLDILFITLLNSLISFAIVVVLRNDVKRSIYLSYTKLSGFFAELAKSKDYFLYLFLLLFVGQLASALVKIYYLPPHVYDVFTYHLHPVVEWFQQGMIPFHIDSPVWRVNGNPLGAKFFHFWFVVFWGEIQWIELPQFLYGILLALVSYGILLKLNIQRNRALRYAIVIYFIPAVLLQARSCQDHLILTACTMTALFYFIEIFYEGNNSRLIFLALILSLLFSIKRHSALVIFMMFAALLVSRGFNRTAVFTMIRENKKRLLWSIISIIILCSYFFFKSPLLYKNYLLRQPKVLLFKFLLPMALFLGIVVIINRLLKKTYNKRFPSLLQKTKIKRVLFLLGIIFTVITAGWLIKTHVLNPGNLNRHAALLSGKKLSRQQVNEMGKFTANLLSFPDRVKDSRSSYGADLFKISGFGVQFFVFGVIAYFLAIPLSIFKKEYRNGILGFLIIFAVLLLTGYFFYYYSFFSYRSYIFFPVIGLIAWAFILTKLNLKNYFLGYIDVLILVMLIFNTAVCFFEGHHTDIYKWKTSFTMSNRLDRTTVQYSAFIKGSEWEFMDKYIPPEQAISYYSGIDSWIFPYFDNQLKRKIYFLKTLPGFKAPKKNSRRELKITPDFIESLRHRDVHFIHLNPQGIRPRNRLYIGDIKGNKDIVKVSANLYYIKYK